MACIASWWQNIAADAKFRDAHEEDDVQAVEAARLRAKASKRCWSPKQLAVQVLAEVTRSLRDRHQCLADVAEDLHAQQKA